MAIGSSPASANVWGLAGDWAASPCCCTSCEPATVCGRPAKSWETARHPRLGEPCAARAHQLLRRLRPHVPENPQVRERPRASTLPPRRRPRLRGMASPIRRCVDAHPRAQRHSNADCDRPFRRQNSDRVRSSYRLHAQPSVPCRVAGRGARRPPHWVSRGHCHAIFGGSDAKARHVVRRDDPADTIRDDMGAGQSTLPAAIGAAARAYH